jgi:flagellar biogenesis protein FliO
MTPEALALQRTPIITFGYVMQVVISLLVVLAFIYFAARYLLPRLKMTPAGKLIKVVDRVYLEPQVTAYILRVGKSAWLLVSSNKQIARIDKIEEEDIPL